MMMLRKRAGLTLEALGKMIGEHAGTIHGWEKTGKIGKFEAIPKVAAALGVTIDELMGAEPVKERRGKVGILEDSLKRATKLNTPAKRRVKAVLDVAIEAEEQKSKPRIKVEKGSKEDWKKFDEDMNF